MKTSIFQIILLAVFGALAVAGILIFAFAAGGGSQANGIGKVVIWGTLDKNAFRAVLDVAAQENPELQQVTYSQKDSATFEQALSDALAQNAAPDMIILTSDYAVKDELKIAPLTYAQLGVVDFNAYFAEAGNVFLGKAGVIGVPFLIDPMVLYWNRDMLAGAGYSEPPKTWEDVLAMAPVFIVRTSSGQIQQSVIAMGTYRNIGNAKADLSLLMLQKRSPIVVRDSSGFLASALSTAGVGATKRPAEDALAFYTGFADPSQSQYSWNGAMQDARAAFAAGDTALYLGFASEASRISAMNPNLNFAIAPVPQFDNAPRDANYGRAYAFAVPRVSNNQQGAFLAAQYLNTATTTTAFAAAFGIASARRDALGQPAAGYGALFNKMAILSRSWPDPDPVQTDDLFRAMIENTISGVSSLPESIQRADQQMAHIITPGI